MRGAAMALLSALFALPASAVTITVTTTVDDATSGNCSLREAVQAAQTNLAVDACPPGSPNLENSILIPAGVHALQRGEIVLGGLAPLRLLGPAAPAASTIRGSEVSPARLFRLQPDANVTFERLTLTLGAHSNSGGAILSQLASLVLRDCRLEANSAPIGGGLNYWGGPGNSLLIERTVFASNEAFSSSSFAYGGGAWLALSDGATSRIVDSHFDLNAATATSGSNGVQGGGLDIEVFAGAVSDVVRTRFTRNRTDCGPSGSSLGAGLYINAGGVGTSASVIDSTVSDNNVIPPSSTLYSGGLYGIAQTGGALVLSRLRIVDNDPGESGIQLPLSASGGGSIVASDLLVANGPATGLAIDCTDSLCLIAHATITGHSLVGADLRAHGTGQVRLENSIVFASSLVPLTGAASIDPSSLIGVDPAFVAPLAGDYAIGASSPAIDYGDATLGSAGPYDLAHAPRVVGPDTDAGAYERGGLFADGFESGDRGAWSSTVP